MTSNVFLTACPAALDVVEVHLGQLGGVVGRERLAPEPALGQHGEPVPRHRERQLDQVGLGLRPQVDDGADAQLLEQDLRVGRRDAVQRVAAVDQAVPGPPPVPRAQSAEVTDVESALQVHGGHRAHSLVTEAVPAPASTQSAYPHDRHRLAHPLGASTGRTGRLPDRSRLGPWSGPARRSHRTRYAATARISVPDSFFQSAVGAAAVITLELVLPWTKQASSVKWCALIFVT